MTAQLTALSIGLSVTLLALAALLALYFLVSRRVQVQRSERLVERLIEPELSASELNNDHRLEDLGQRTAASLEAIGRGFGSRSRQESSEDARMLRQAGWRAPRAVFVFTGMRMILVLTALIGSLVGMGMAGVGLTKGWPVIAALGILAYLVPKFVLQSKASKRMGRFRIELPFFVDMLALLQGVGLSLEQSLYSLSQAQDIGLPVISRELATVNRQIAAGRSRMDAMQRMADMLADPDFAELIVVLRQIERYGGDVANTLRGYSQRLQDKQRMSLRERIGKLTVKMTGVMILTMLPALLMITAGPGFLAVIRFLDRMTG